MEMAMIGVKIPVSTRMLLEQQVEAEDTTISAFVRQLIEQAAKQPLVRGGSDARS